MPVSQGLRFVEMTYWVQSTSQNVMQSSNLWNQLIRTTYATTKDLKPEKVFFDAKLWITEM